MATQDIEDLPNQFARASRLFGPAMEATFRETERRARPKFNAAARNAAGADRILSGIRNRRARLDVKFEIVAGRTRTLLYIDPIGPWGIRDNTDIGGKTASHRIYPKEKTILKFAVGDDTVYAYSVNHPGSQRGPYWRQGQDAAIEVAQRRVPEEVSRAIDAALNSKPFSSR